MFLCLILTWYSFFFLNRLRLLGRKLQTQPMNSSIRFDLVASKILSTAENQSFSIYVTAPDDRSNYNLPAYLYPIEKKSNINYAQLDYRGNWIIKKLNPAVEKIFLICRNFNDHNEITKRCLLPFKKEYMSKYQMETIDMQLDYIYVFGNIKSQ